MHGYARATWWAVGIEALAALIALTFINVGRPGSTTVAAGTGEVADEAITPPVRDGRGRAA